MLKSIGVTGFFFKFQCVLTLRIMYYIYVLICDFDGCLYASELLPAEQFLWNLNVKCIKDQLQVRHIQIVKSIKITRKHFYSPVVQCALYSPCRESIRPTMRIFFHKT